MMSGDFKGWWARHGLLDLATWCVAVLLFANVLIFAMRTACPALIADDWYFFHVFGLKAIDHTLTFADFFVRRFGPDHSEPFIKLIILWCLRFFHMDLSVEALIGVLIAFSYALVFRFVIFTAEATASQWARHLAWLTITAALLSLNSTLIWSWAENSMQYSSDILIPVFLWSVWRAYKENKYLLLPIVTFFMAVVGDDNAVICVLATFIALGLYLLLGQVSDRRSLLRVFVEVFIVLVVVRLGYHFAPRIGGAPMSLSTCLHGIYAQIKAGHWHEWIEPPLAWGVVSRSFFPVRYTHLFKPFLSAVFVLMLLLQVWFWVKAFRSKWNMLTFMAICLMLVTYGWIAGIFLYRASVFGADAFSQPRYVRLYEFEIIAMVMMWLGSITSISEVGSRGWVRRFGVAGCVAFLLLQLPLSVTAWDIAPYIQKYYQDIARQEYALAMDPTDARVLANCNPSLSLCLMPVSERTGLIDSLRANHLSIFSNEVVKSHPLLLNAAFSLPLPDRVQLLSDGRKGAGGISAEGLYGRVRHFFLRADEGRPGTSVSANALKPTFVPLLLHGCWPSDGARNDMSSWCGPHISVVLRVPPDASTLRVEGEIPWTLYAQAGRTSAVTVAIAADGVTLAKKAVASDGKFQIDVPARALPDVTRTDDLLFITISTDGSFVPSHFSSSKDSRELAMRMSSVGFLTAAQ